MAQVTRKPSLQALFKSSLSDIWQLSDGVTKMHRETNMRMDDILPGGTLGVNPLA